MINAMLFSGPQQPSCHSARRTGQPRSPLPRAALWYGNSALEDGALRCHGSSRWRGLTRRWASKRIAGCAGCRYCHRGRRQCAAPPTGRRPTRILVCYASRSSCQAAAMQTHERRKKQADARNRAGSERQAVHVGAQKKEIAAHFLAACACETVIPHPAPAPAYEAHHKGAVNPATGASSAISR